MSRVDESLPPALARPVGLLKDTHGTTLIVDGLKRFTCCGSVVGRMPSHNWDLCVADAIQFDPTSPALTLIDDSVPDMSANSG